MKQSHIGGAETPKINDDEYGSLLEEKPYCDMFLSKTSVKPPYNLVNLFFSLSFLYLLVWVSNVM